MENLTVSVIQFDIKWENTDYNLEYLASLINNVKKIDLIILPEMFTTGFIMNPKKMDSDHQSKVITWMQNIAKSKNCAICGSIIFKEENHYFNRFIWTDDTNQLITYNKNHLFTLAGEEKFYSRDHTEAPIIDYKNWRILPQICYDLRFPETARNTPNRNYDLLIYVANWPDRRSYAWKTLLKARAIENISYVVGCNRIGYDGNDVYHSGDSQIISYDGSILNNTNKHSINYDLNKAELINFREKYSFLKDQF